ncbi:unnamed protein product [Cylicostephanus goldi]|uniref:Uncharacterized protein n=1 Tax=Cylicostephanus goldi TaxID=71465 RepID=A0A3P6UAL4_CYLGO|nr:unnamed protein product [Cylicostephanus goldi]
MRAGFPPVILPVESRAEYYATLHIANLGDLRPFVRYVARHTENTLQVWISECLTTGLSLSQESWHQIYLGEVILLITLQFYINSAEKCGVDCADNGLRGEESGRIQSGSDIAQEAVRS